MICPRCGNEEFSPGGICPACNFKDGQRRPAGEQTREEAVPSEPDAAEKLPTNQQSKNTGEELPEWRLQLWKRLETLKKDQNREEAGPSESNAEAKPPVNPQTTNTDEELPEWRLELWKRLETLKKEQKLKGRAIQARKEPEVPEAPAPKIVQIDRNTRESVPSAVAGDAGAENQAPIPRKKTVNLPTQTPLQKTIASLGEKVFQQAKPDPSGDIRDLIDNVVSRQSAQSIPETSVFTEQAVVDPEDKYILLSRTLSGLIDLIIVVLCTAAFIIAADSFAGIVVLDAISIIEYTVLFLMIFFLYSIFFLAASGQTVGMMITDLRVIGIADGRPSVSQLFARCFGYLLSVVVLGAGLFWSFFDRESRCLHDRLSDTSIIRM